MALSASQIYRSRERGRISVVVQAGATIYNGALVGLDQSDGEAINWTHATSTDAQFLGVAYITDQTNSAAAAGESVTGLTDNSVRVSVDTSGVVLESVTVTGVSALTHVGDLLYASDDNTFTLTAGGTASPIGYVARWYTGTTCDVQLFTDTEFRAYKGA